MSENAATPFLAHPVVNDERMKERLTEYVNKYIQQLVAKIADTT